MYHFYTLEEVHLKHTWLTIGSFDGVHLGHQAIIKQLTDGAHRTQAQAVVITFFPHPSVVIRKRTDFHYLTTPEERAKLLGELGVDVVITHPFNQQIAQLSAQEFMDRIEAHLKPDHLIVGHDFALGRNRSGNVDELILLGEEMDYILSTVPPVRINGEIISSSRIRSALAEGNVVLAHRMLNRPYRISGIVIPGDGRGKTIGIPTANVDTWKERVIPKSGVYAGYAHTEGKTWNAVINIGVRPTFSNNSKKQHIEAYILEFRKDIYGKHIQLDFIARIRDEKRFPNVTALVDQINLDTVEAKSLLESETI
jgi:riboflavin kinase/FMN adenylyltransferase